MAGKKGYETFYSKSKQGVLPEIIKEFYDERVSIKKQMRLKGLNQTSQKIGIQ